MFCVQQPFENDDGGFFRLICQFVLIKIVT